MLDILCYEKFTDNFFKVILFCITKKFRITALKASEAGCLPVPFDFLLGRELLCRFYWDFLCFRYWNLCCSLLTALTRFFITPTPNFIYNGGEKILTSYLSVGCIMFVYPGIYWSLARHCLIL